MYCHVAVYRRELTYTLERTRTPCVSTLRIPGLLCRPYRLYNHLHSGLGGGGLVDASELYADAHETQVFLSNFPNKSV